MNREELKPETFVFNDGLWPIEQVSSFPVTQMYWKILPRRVRAPSMVAGSSFL